MNKKALLFLYSYRQKLRKLLALVIILLSVITVLALPGFASLYELKDEVDAYNHGDFQNVVFIGRVIENESVGLDNETARYYLAGAYARLNRTQEAIQEYRSCWIDGKDPRIKAYAEQALKVLQPDGMPKSFIRSNKLGISDGSNIKFVPKGSNLYVRNYLNYDGDIPPLPKEKGLKASQQVLKLNIPIYSNQKGL